MASLTGKHTDPVSRNRAPGADGSPRADDQERLGAFSGIRA